ncbi:MAG TPA: S-methyl-5-thioribose-1-phosphate isomerase, partial [Proteobacteria bacterium]|nr:S-methyl-5-thioribose-1-phosphate isomerase [Pseudomonadota bacterium]
MDLRDPLEGSNVRHIRWAGDAVVFLDQRKLPEAEVYVACRDYREVARAIKSMLIRGAPLIGIAAAFGMALAAREAVEKGTEPLGLLDKAKDALARTRPTAVNLFWALDRMQRCASTLEEASPDELYRALLAEAFDIWNEDVEANRRMGIHGSALIEDGSTVLTHCNAGALATGGYGTALGLIRAAVEQGKRVRVLADETRPYLQGARLTAWELNKDGIEVEVIT